MNLTYRRDIDGLRAVAVSSVVLFHAIPSALPGGFVGVDIFFVISGYLISSILTTDIDAKLFSIPEFYRRRVVRLFPALITVLMAILVAGALLLRGFDYATLARNTAASGVFIANLAFWKESSYFSDAAALNPVLHLWSLGVEEQFYIFWPVVLIMVARVRANRLAITLIIAAISFIYCVMTVSVDRTAAFYSPLARTWELMIGAALAFAPAPASRPLRNYCSLIGAAMIAVSFFLITSQSVVPGWLTLLPAGGGALIIAVGPDAVINSTVLSWKPVVTLGLISYPLYLWHWPLLSFASNLSFDEMPPHAVRILLVAASVGLAWATNRFVEQNAFQRLKLRARTLSGAMAALVGATLLISAAGGLPQRDRYLDPRQVFVSQYRTLHETGLDAAYRSECDFYDWKTHLAKRAISPSCTDGTKPTIFLWGDSHAQALSYGLRRADFAGATLDQVATSGCRPSLSLTRRQTPGNACNASNRFALAAIGKLKPEVVVLAQERDHELTDWDALAKRVHELGVHHVVLIGPVPQWRPSLPSVIARFYWRTPKARAKIGLDQSIFRTDATLASRYRASPNLSYISLTRPLCNADGCIAWVPDGMAALVAVDYGHLSPAGSAFVARTIVDIPVRSALASN